MKDTIRVLALTSTWAVSACSPATPPQGTSTLVPAPTTAGASSGAPTASALPVASKDTATAPAAPSASAGPSPQANAADATSLTPVKPPFDPVSFALACLVFRATAENDPNWKLFGCPASPAPLPAKSQPKAIVRRSPAYTALLRTDLSFDPAGHMTKARSSFEKGLVTETTYDYGTDGELQGLETKASGTSKDLPRSAGRVTVQREGDTTTILLQHGGGNLRHIFVPPATGHGSFEQVFLNARGPEEGVHWTLRFDGRKHVATCDRRCNGETLELSFDDAGKPVDAARYIESAHATRSTRKAQDRYTFVWQNDKLVGLDAFLSSMDRKARVMDIVW